MRAGFALAEVAALIGEPNRAAMLGALADGRALPAGELAATAGASAPAASAHLAKLVEGGLLAVERHGRHRYYRLANPQVASTLEGLAVLAGPPSSRSAGSRTEEAQALRRARTCYDHLAGEVGVEVAVALEARGFLAAGEDGKRLDVTVAGAGWFAATLGIDVGALAPGRHGLAWRCLDWTERRHHLAGPLARRLLHRLCELGWLARAPGTRSVRVTPPGRNGLRDALGLHPGG